MMADYHLFLSYSRKDNAEGEGWITAFAERLKRRHAYLAGRPLEVFFDKTSIDHGADWERTLREGLRQSRLFLAFLSPNYIASRWCRMEWEEYLRLEHSLARGDGGVAPIYMVHVPQLEGAPADEAIADWIADIQRRNRDARVDLREWFDEGPGALMQLDAEERLAEVKAHQGLAERIDRLDRHITSRLDDALLAEIADEVGRLDQSYGHFVGRAAELRDLHAALMADKISLIGALHGLGGQGKTALSVQYAHAYAGHFAAGGRWQIECSGVPTLAEALSRLAQLQGIKVPEPPEGMSEEDGRAFVVARILAELKRVTYGRVEAVVAARNAHPELRGGPLEAHLHIARMLVIFDNVDEPGLLSARALAPVAAQEWLRL
ncbi:MAG: toll/interleukin-1 receptor domain-containing protein, partial [Pseudomonadota bacterium]